VAGSRHLAATLLVLGVLLQNTSGISALTPQGTGSNALSLSPFLQNITVSESDTTKSFNLELTNHSPTVQELDLKTRDFGSLNDTGGILLEGSADDYSQHYGLTSWLTLEADTVVLQPGEARSIVVSVNNRQDLQPGGHYAAVVASVKSLDDQSGNKVVVNQQLLSLILVDKQGGDHYDLKLKSVEQNGNWLHLPNDIKLQFQNPGNVHVVPRGQVLLKNPAGSVIAKGIINTETAFVLPATLRDLYVRLTPVGHSLPLPGVYHVEVDYRYDGIDQTANKSFAVRFINLKLYTVIILLVGAGIWFARRRRTSSKTHSQNSHENEAKTSGKTTNKTDLKQ
jgi:hypothetical protein